MSTTTGRNVGAAGNLARGGLAIALGIVTAIVQTGTATPARADEGVPTGTRSFTARVPAKVPVLRIVEPDGEALTETPERVEIVFGAEQHDLVRESRELWLDGGERTEDLRFWVDRAWLDLGPRETWRPGPHTIEARIVDRTGNTHPFDLDLDLKAPSIYEWPFDYDTPNVVANLLEDYQKFSKPVPYWHHGLDLRANAGSDVHAVIGGYVGYVGCYLGCDQLQWNVTIVGDDDFIWQYAHLNEGSIDHWQIGDRVETGELLGTVVSWPFTGEGPNYHHIHLNTVQLEGFDVDAWRADAVDPGETPETLPEPLSANFKWFNPLLFLAQAGDLDTLQPQFGGEKWASAPDICFLRNQTNVSIATDEDVAPVVDGDVDVVAHLFDTRDVIAGIPGQPYTLGLYEIAWSVVPLDPGCGKGWVPYTLLRRFKKVPGGFDQAVQADHLLDVFQRWVEVGGATYETLFDWTHRDLFYNVTNTFYGTLDRQKGYWNTDGATIQGPLFADGDYRVTVFAKDFGGNTLTKSVDVEVDNGLAPPGFCPGDIRAIDPQGLVVTSALSGQTATFDPSVAPVAFGPIAEGSAFGAIGFRELEPWHFDFGGYRLAIGLLEGEEATVEYVPYLGDVILEIPAEAQFLPWDGSPPAPQFDPFAAPSNPVSLRLVTRLARDPWTGDAYVGSRQPTEDVEFSLVGAAVVLHPSFGEHRLVVPIGGRTQWLLEGGPK